MKVILTIILIGLTLALFLNFQKTDKSPQTEIASHEKFGVVADDISTLKNDVNLNNQVNAVASGIGTKQATYIGNHVKYFQGLSTHSIPPDYGSPTVPDKLNLKPADKDATWVDIGQTNTALPFALRINELVYPDKSIGYQLIFTLTLNQNRYSKAIGTGLQAKQFTHDWQNVEKPY